VEVRKGKRRLVGVKSGLLLLQLYNIIGFVSPPFRLQFQYHSFKVIVRGSLLLCLLFFSLSPVVLLVCRECCPVLVAFSSPPSVLLVSVS